MGTIKKIKRGLLSVVMTLLVVALFYIRYQHEVNRGQAKSIEELKIMVIKGIGEKYDSIHAKDSIIVELQDSLSNKR